MSGVTQHDTEGTTYDSPWRAALDATSAKYLGRTSLTSRGEELRPSNVYGSCSIHALKNYPACSLRSKSQLWDAECRASRPVLI